MRHKKFNTAVWRAGYFAGVPPEWEAGYDQGVIEVLSELTEDELKPLLKRFPEWKKLIENSTQR